MSTKRARYAGPFPEVTVYWPPGETAISQQQFWTVKYNHQLPDDVPAKLRDELLAGEDWTAVEQSTTAEKGDK